MKKISKIIITVVLSFLILNKKAFAIDYSKGFYINDALELNRTEIIGSNSSILGDSTAGDTYFKLAQLKDGDSYTIAYCSNGDKDVYPVDKKVTMTKNCHELSNNKKSLIYTYENGYNYTLHNKSYTATDYLTGEYLKDYYITQSSVWYYTKPSAWMSNFNLSNGTYKNNSNNIITKITKLINDAKEAEEGSKLNIEITDTKMTLTTDEKYYISSPIKLTGTYLNSKININISGSENAFATTDKGSTSGTSIFDSNSTIYIKVPNNGQKNIDITVTATANTYLNEGKIIECNHETNDESQPMIIYVPKSTTLTKNIKLSLNKYTVKISKKDINNSEEIEGATLAVKNSSGVTIDTWISTKETKEISLVSGKYTLEETIAPNGYIKSTNKIDFTIDDNGKVLVGGKEVSKIIITNEPILVTISKRSITGSKELEGAKLKITDKEGNIATDIFGKKLEWESTTTAKIVQLKTGDYILSEESAPSGYELSEKIINFTINSEGKVLIEGKEVENNLIIFKNTPEPKQVPTGNTIIYIAGSLCLISIAVAIYLIIKRKEI